MRRLRVNIDFETAMMDPASEDGEGEAVTCLDLLRDEPEIIDAWHEFEAGARRRRVLAFLVEHGIEPIDAGEAS